MKTAKILSAIVLGGMLSLTSHNAQAIDVSTMPTYTNIHGKSVTTPVAWGASGNVIFFGAGGTYPSPYSNDKADGAAVLGFGIGDPVENLGFQVSIVSLDITEWEEYSLFLHASKHLGDGNSIGIGVENIMITEGGDGEASYYIVYSQGVMNDPFINEQTGNSKLHFSVGVGNGRFGDKSQADIDDGKGEHGTYVFGNIAYEIANSFNVIADWNGINLNAGVSKTFWLTKKLPFAITLGAADLTDYSGDGVRLVVGGGSGFRF